MFVIASAWFFSVVTTPFVSAEQQTETAPPVVAKKKAPLRFSVTFDESITDSFTGRVYLMFDRGETGREPRFGPAWVNPAPFMAIDITDWKPGQEVVFDGQTRLTFPYSIDDLADGTWRAQAVMRRNMDSPNIGTGEGSVCSEVATFTVDSKDAAMTPEVISLHLNRVIDGPKFVETDRVKLIEVKSDLLSNFHKRDITMHAGIILPKNYDENANRRFPTLYWIGGFGSTHYRASGMARMLDAMGVGDDWCVVVLDPSCYFGHHVFADSATNGPRGQSLVEEFIPEIEKQYRVVADPNARFLSGASSGGWSSLWLQVTYPEFFCGTWSLVPDPVDFRDFQRINLYVPDVNMYRDENGDRRPLMRFTRNGVDQIVVLYEDFAKMEVVMGEGGQLRSFEAVFSPRGKDGLPLPLYDRKTGAVFHEVAEAWKPYDIRLRLAESWSTLGPKLAGKIHVFAGDDDNFYLDGAARLLKKSLVDLKSDAVVEILPGRNHGSVLDPAMMQRIQREALNWFVTHTNTGAKAGDGN